MILILIRYFRNNTTGVEITLYIYIICTINVQVIP